MSALAFVLIALVIVTGALVTVLAANAVHAALGLVATLIGLAMMYTSLNAHFLAATQVIVYAGAIMVLFLFVIMLLDASQPVTAQNKIPFVNEIAALGAGLLATSIGLIALTWKAPRALATATAHLQDGSPAAVGETLLTKFVFPFEAVSVLLLVAIVGSVVLVRKPVPSVEEAPEGQAVTTGERELGAALLSTPVVERRNS
ncbi:NADH-quinone oxidoreductase subunit J family protein [Deinococcus yavapaiensis]|uniref:NADH-quinone oxidoreductase subunit J n=1 Tax=Deinococcus yavapaiensis KR-236 TaxID=694435 RepID=A0A318SPX0_9DEIO|nr:NADH-quinone oxidoreductase subunit J [Deinococcus yavapaiensis]PYE54873.1 NADH dehydrogenase subunit J [Deinococcus yavapaiensis KR-236]